MTDPVDPLRAMIADIVRVEVAKALAAATPAKARRSRTCGTGVSPPVCYGSAVYGPEGCYCR